MRFALRDVDNFHDELALQVSSRMFFFFRRACMRMHRGSFRSLVAFHSINSRYRIKVFVLVNVLVGFAGNKDLVRLNLNPCFFVSSYTFTMLNGLGPK